MSTAPNIPLRAWIDLLLLALIWGAIFLFIEYALDGMTPLWIVFHRVFWAMLLLWLYVIAKGMAVPRGLAVWGAFLVMGALNNVIPFGLITWGQTEIESGLASILNATTAFSGIVVASIFLVDERLTARRLAGVAVGVLGVAVIMGLDVLTAFDLRALGQLAILGATTSYAFAGVWARLYMKGLTPAVSAAGMLTGSSLIMLPLAWMVEGTPTLPHGALTIASLAYISVIGTFCAYLLYYRILAAAGSGNLMLVTIMMPPLSILLGAVFLGEKLAPSTYIGCALIAAGLIILDGRALSLLGKGRKAA
ncbi:MAG: DMT family transporter [Pseudomonadota bacterium]